MYFSLIYSMGLLLMSFFFLEFSFIVLMKGIWFELELHWASLDFSPVMFLLFFDYISSAFISVVTLISSVVLMYSSVYMVSDETKNNFMNLVFLFVVSMMLMIASPNLISILLGWDGLGLVSYMLVVYFQTSKSYAAGMITFLSNRIGDLMLLLAVGWIANWGMFDFSSFQLLIFSFDTLLISLFIFFACITKSAQIPFSAWLPAAMAAPTPVSSLVHSSTLVTAGVYLIIRFNLMSMVSNWLLFISLTTMYLSGMSALYETDMKKIIALSTLSQLGLMMFSISIGMKDIAFYHLLSHALFKSLIFLCSGSYIHYYSNTQDLRLLMGMPFISNLTLIYFFYSNLSLMGIFFLAGFYSKDFILEMFSLAYMSWILIFAIFLSVGLTALYTLRLLKLCIFFKMKSFNSYNKKMEDLRMGIPMTTLFVSSLMGGSVLSWMYFPLNLSFIYYANKFFASFILILTIFLMLIIYNNLNFNKTSSLLGKMWLLPMVTSLSSFMVLTKMSKLVISLDQGWFEVLGAKGLAGVAENLALKGDKIFGTGIQITMFLMLIYFNALVLAS